MRRCPERTVLQQYLDEALASSDGDSVEGHIEKCKACQKLLAALVETDTPTGLAPKPPATPTPEAVIERFAALAIRLAHAAADPDPGAKMASRRLGS